MHENLEGAETLSLAKAADYLIEECRMVLPGVQALFGFQLVAVFNQRFDDALTHGEKLVHLGAIALVGVAIALIMTPAAYHRLTAPDRVTGHFVRISTRLLMLGMPFLMLGLVLDTYLVGRLIDGHVMAGVVAALLMAVFSTLWFGLPLLARARRSGEASR